ncbi:MAG: winged helix-turn-helix domain-containing protein [Bacteroidota bacterium]
MSGNVFLINDRFRIFPALNQVQDMQSGQTTRLEPRIMAVLEMLTAHAGQLVSREEMIREIWHNYGGGDEGLSQAVSFLRKILVDGEKKMIQTIPKKGYRLTGLLSTGKTLQTKSAAKSLYLRPLSRFALLLYVAGTVIYFLYNSLYRHPAAAGQQVALVKHSDRQAPVVMIHPKVRKTAQLAANRRSAVLPMLRKNPHTESAQTLPAADQSAQAITRYYHSSDTTAQMITALDYRVTMQVQVNTALN